jgi:hypothetical protein
MLDSQATFAPFLDSATAVAEPVQADTSMAPLACDATAVLDPQIAAQFANSEPATAEARPVTPRRPLRFSFARSAEDAAPVTLPVSNIFAGIFDEDDLSTAGVDPRLARSRHRARAILAAREASLPIEEANLWHDFGTTPIAEPAPTPAQATPDLDATTALRGRRPVRHLTSADLLAHRPTEAPVQDPLQDHLHRVRDALYAPDPEAEAAEAAARPSLPARLAAHALNLALVVTALPLGAAMMIYTFFRGEDLRLSARMVAIAGTALTVLQLGFDRLA